MTVLQRLKRWARGQEDAAPAPVGPAELRILMVCTGNICRSPMAEGVLRAKLAAAGLAGRVQVDSAGTHGYHTSEPPDPRAIRIAARRGYAIDQLRARPVTPEDYAGFDWMLALDDGHLSWLHKRGPAGHAVRLERLMDHARRHAAVSEVPDPYYGPDAGFEHVLDLVEDACDGVVVRVQEHLAGKA